MITVYFSTLFVSIDEVSYEELKKYLDTAERTLFGSDDSGEVLKDIEYAIADKLLALTAHGKKVVTPEIMRAVLAQMGPVRKPDADSESSEAPPAEPDTDNYTRRLYQIPKGAILTGVCNGLAAYLKMDVRAVRIIFVILAVVTHGLAVFGYLISP